MPLVVDSTGRELGPVASGRDGNGKFRNPFDAVPVGDSVVVFDLVAGTAVVVGPTLDWVRDIAFDVHVNRVVVERWPDRLIGTGIIGTPDAVGWSLHRISVRGDRARVLSSFGSGDGQVSPGDEGQIFERMIIGPHGELWSFRRASYDISRWDSTDRVIQTLRRRPAWFSQSNGASVGGPQQAPTPIVSGILIDSTGLIWTFISRPAETWRQAWPKVGPGLVEIPVSAVAFEKLYKTTIEVIDPKQRRVVARLLTNTLIIEALPNQRAVAYTVDANGNRQVSVISLSLDRGRTARH